MYAQKIIVPDGKAMLAAAQAVAKTVPTSGSSMGREARRLVLFERAKEAVGGSRKLGLIIDKGRRTVNHKLVAERRLTSWDLKLTADALEVMARDLDQLVADIRKVI